MRAAQTGYIDYDKLEEKALDFRPKMLICGGSAYPREWDYKRLYEIAQKVGALLMSDMAHIRCAPRARRARAPAPLAAPLCLFAPTSRAVLRAARPARRALPIRRLRCSQGVS